MAQQPFISPDKHLPELTIKSLCLGIFLAVILAASNTFLALKIGILTASSIPAAILSMGVLRLFSKHNVLENNAVQTCASAGEAIAGGVVYTAPALIIIHAWLHFPFFQTFLLALSGGALGIIITIPLRRYLMHHQKLKFPEAQAISQVLISGTERHISMKPMLIGGAIGAIMEMAQTAFKLIASSAQLWITRGTTIVGFGTGFSATLIGAGYLMGIDVGISIFIGALITHAVGVPIYSHFFTHPNSLSVYANVHDILSNHLRYMGISAMLTSGVITLLALLLPLFRSMKDSLRKNPHLIGATAKIVLRTEKDTPSSILLFFLSVVMIVLGCLFFHLFHLQLLEKNSVMHVTFIASSVLFVVIFGCLFSAICAYFSGLVGVAASPGSSVAIATALIASSILLSLMHLGATHLSPKHLKAAAAITIMMTTVIMGAACVANNNSQDLKVAHIMGATPWKMQLMLSIGAVAAAIIAPLVMQLLFHVYGIAQVLPVGGLNPEASLPAPPAAAMAAVAQAVFHQNLPIHMMITGSGVIILAALVKPLLKRFKLELSLIGIAIGMYLPLSSSMPLIFGAIVCALVNRRNPTTNHSKSVIAACGLVAGAALTNVIVAIPLALMKHPETLTLLPSQFHRLSELLGMISTLGIAYFLYRMGVAQKRH